MQPEGVHDLNFKCGFKQQVSQLLPQLRSDDIPNKLAAKRT